MVVLGHFGPLTFKKNWWGGPPLVQSLDIVDNGPDKEWPKCFNALCVCLGHKEKEKKGTHAHNVLTIYK